MVGFWFSWEFFDSDDFGVEGGIDLQGFLDLMRNPADAVSLNLNGNRMVDSGAIFKNYAYAVFVFGFHGFVSMSCGSFAGLSRCLGSNPAREETGVDSKHS